MSSLVGILNAPNRYIYIYWNYPRQNLYVIEGATSFSETDRLLYTKIGVERDGTPFICLEFKGMQISVIYCTCLVEFLQTEMQEVHIPSQHGISVQRTKTALWRETKQFTKKKQGSQRVTPRFARRVEWCVVEGIGILRKWRAAGH